MPATNENTKRKKTSDPSTEARLSPSKITEGIISTFLASLPKPISLIGDNVFKTHMKLMNDVDKTETRLASLQPDSGKLPSSVEYNFKLNSTATIKETQEFKTLEAQCTEHIDYCKRLLKDACRQVAELELTDLKKRSKNHFCEALALLAAAFIKYDGSIPDTQESVHTLVFATIDKELNHLMVSANTARVAKNAARVELSQLSQVVPEDDPLIINSAIFKHSGFQSKFEEEQDQQEFYDYFHSHTKATTAKYNAVTLERTKWTSLVF